MHPRYENARRVVLDTVVHVTYPDSDEWQPEPLHTVTEVGSRIWSIKVKLVTPGRFLFMTARDYSVPRDQLLPPAKLLDEVYAGNYRKVFSKVFSGPIVALADDWWQREWQFVHASAGVIRKIERVKCARDHVLIASAEGRSEDYAAYEEDVMFFLGGVQFAPMFDTPAPSA